MIRNHVRELIRLGSLNGTHTEHGETSQSTFIYHEATRVSSHLPKSWGDKARWCYNQPRDTAATGRYTLASRSASTSCHHQHPPPQNNACKVRYVAGWQAKEGGKALTRTRKRRKKRKEKKAHNLHASPPKHIAELNTTCRFSLSLSALASALRTQRRRET